MTLRDNVVGQRQSETGPLAGFFGRKKGFKYVRQSLLIHAFAVIGDFQPDKFTGKHIQISFTVVFIQNGIAALNNQLAAINHGISGIDAQIHYHLFDVNRIAIDNLKIASMMGFDADHLGNGPFQQLFQLPDLLIEIERTELTLKFTTEGEKLLGQGGRPFRRPRQGVSVAISDIGVVAILPSRSSR